MVCANRRTAASRSSSSKRSERSVFWDGRAQPGRFFLGPSPVPAMFPPCACQVGGDWTGLYIRAQENEFMSQVLMPKATAVWLVENSTLTFDQISAFTGLHPLEVQAIADGEVAGGMTGLDPTTNGQLTKEEIKRAENDPAARLKLSPRNVPMLGARSKAPPNTSAAKPQ